MQSLQDESENDEQEQPLEIKPLRSLAPMIPTPLGYDVTTQSTDPMLVIVTPFRPRTSSEQSPSSFGQPLPKSPIPLRATPISATFPMPQCKDESSDEDYKPFCDQKKATSPKTAKRTQEAGYSDAANIKRRSTRRSLNLELTSCPSSSSNPNESVGEIMMMFDSLRRRILQLDEKEDASRRADLKAGSLMMQNGLRVSNLKTIGPVPGVKIGDIFFFRIEMCIVGLHAPAMAGIDYISAKNAGKDGTLAVSIISSGGYENDDGDSDILVYTGQGGNSRHKEKHDQKLERGNLALMNSMKKKNVIRVVRSAQDPFCNSGKIYIYDGLYRIEGSWMDKAKNGYSVFKYQLKRAPGQPDGISVWKMTEKWKENPATRDKAILLDLSSKIENLPVCLVNDVDDEKGPSFFNYVTGVEYLRPLNKTKPLQSCKCPSVCLPGDPNCSCSQLNSGDLPYSSSGLLVKQIPMLYECSSRCQCSQNCRNRVTQKGVYLNFEVFWTGDRGWGVRSWDPIRAGTFICEYADQNATPSRSSPVPEPEERRKTKRRRRAPPSKRSAGVAVCTVTDVSVNAKGLIAAVIAVWSTALQQYYVHFLQRKHSLNSFNLLGHTAPAQAGSLLLVGPFVDYLLTGQRVDHFNFSSLALFFLVLSCFIAIGVNLSQFICIGRFSAVSFQVLGHMKTVLVLSLGFLFFGKEGLNLQVVLGMVLAVIGMIWYGNASAKPGGKERRSVLPVRSPSLKASSEEPDGDKK
nr:unnamed protein product [Digitaria exilis]